MVLAKPNEQVVADIEGDLLGHRGLMDLSTKRLLIPSLRAWQKETIPPEYQVSSCYNGIICIAIVVFCSFL